MQRESFPDSFPESSPFRSSPARALPFTDNLWPGIILITLLSGAGLWYGGWWAWENHLFADHGRHMEARVLRKYVTESHGKHGTIQYTPRIAYGYQVGKLVTNSDTEVTSQTWQELAERGAVPIRYLPEDPGDSRIDLAAEDELPARKSWIGLGGGLVALVLGTGFTIKVNRRKKRVEKIRASGLTANGHVTALDSERVGKQMQSFIRFEFTDNQGRVIEGRSLPLTSRQAGLWANGKRIAVYYDPADPIVFTINPNGV